MREVKDGTESNHRPPTPTTAADVPQNASTSESPRLSGRLLPPHPRLARTMWGLASACALLLVCHRAVAFDGQLLAGPNLAADAGLRMPWVGLGTGDHSPNPESSCGFHCNLTATWLGLGGRRLDGADSYGDEVGVGLGIAHSGVPRSEVFITSKVGPPHYNFPLGYDDTLAQADGILANYVRRRRPHLPAPFLSQRHRFCPQSTTWIDLLLIHNPDPKAAVPPIVKPIDQRCVPGSPVYSETECRLATWRAMLALWKQGKAKAIGVANYQIPELAEIESAGLPLPSVNQVVMNPQIQQKALRKWCSARGIHVQAFHSLVSLAPRGRCGPASASATIACVGQGGYSGGGSPMKIPAVVAIARAHNVSAAQVLLNWQIALNVSVNP